MMNKYLRLIFIRIEKQRLRREMDKIEEAYHRDEPEAIQMMETLTDAYGKLYQEQIELRNNETEK